jgi:hypothetical protein
LAPTYPEAVRSDSLAALAVALDPLIELGPPSDDGALAAAESKFGVAFLTELRQLLADANGATVRRRLSDGEVVRALELYWTISEVVLRNLWAGAPAAGGLWFADVGSDGMLFGHPRLHDGTAEPRVVVWMPLDREMVEVARCSASGSLAG